MSLVSEVLDLKYIQDNLWNNIVNWLDLLYMEYYSLLEDMHDLQASVGRGTFPVAGEDTNILEELAGNMNYQSAQKHLSYAVLVGTNHRQGVRKKKYLGIKKNYNQRLRLTDKNYYNKVLVIHRLLRLVMSRIHVLLLKLEFQS